MTQLPNPPLQFSEELLCKATDQAMAMFNSRAFVAQASGLHIDPHRLTNIKATLSATLALMHRGDLGYGAKWLKEGLDLRENEAMVAPWLQEAICKAYDVPGIEISSFSSAKEDGVGR